VRARVRLRVRVRVALWLFANDSHSKVAEGSIEDVNFRFNFVRYF
jgi:hypothetical protein